MYLACLISGNETIGPGYCPWISTGEPHNPLNPVPEYRGDTVTAYMEAADHTDMTGTPADVERVGSFGILNATQGVILGSETPDNAFVKFATRKRYVRLNLTVGGGDTGVGTAKCFLTPYAFPVL